MNLHDFLEETSPHPGYDGPAMRRDKFRYAIFTGTARSLYATGFAELITSLNLGTIMKTGYHTNPNSGNKLQVWIWTLDHDAIAAYRLKLKAEAMPTVKVNGSR